MIACRASRSFKAAATYRQFSSSVLEDFPGAPSTSFYTPAVKPTSTTTTSSGLKITTSPNATSSSVTLTFPAGSASETASQTGAAHASKFLNFASTACGTSTVAHVHALENAGCTTFHSHGRTSSMVGFTGSPEAAHDGSVLGILVKESAYAKWDVRDAIKYAKIESAENDTDTYGYLSSAIFAAGYGAHTPMGKPSDYSSESGCNFDGIKEWRSNAYTTNGAHLCATGIADHSAFVKSVEAAFAGANTKAIDTGAVGGYTGGESRFQGGSDGAHVAMAFDGSGVSAGERMVIKSFLEGQFGKEFSAEGFESDGLVGLVGFSKGEEGGALVDAMSKAFEALGKGGSDGAIESAIKSAKADLAFDYGGSSRGEAKALSLGLGGGIESSAGSFKTAGGLVLKSGVSVASIGDIGSVPFWGTLKTRF